MSGLPSTPPEILAAERERIKRELELETQKSSILYQRQYQRFMEGNIGQPVVEGQIEKTETEDFTSAVKKAYAEAYALRAFREVMQDATSIGTPPPRGAMQQPGETIVANLVRSGIPPEKVNEWLTKLSPEALGALIALTNGNPMLAQMSFAMGQRGGNQHEGLTIKDVIELNQALKDKSPNMNIDLPKLIESLRQAPPTQTFGPKDMIELITTGINLAGGRQEQRQPEERKPAGLLETLMQTPEGARTAKELGLIGNDTGTLAVIAEMRRNDQTFEKMRMDSERSWQLRLEELKANRELNAAKIQEGRERTALISNSLTRIGTAIADAVTKAEPAADTEKVPSNLKPITFECEQCKNTIVVPSNTPVGQTVECPKCHAVYETSSTPSEAPK